MLPLTLPPPKSTVMPRALSYAMRWPERCDGTAGERRCVQFVPSHSQVSPKNGPEYPPNSTATPRVESKTIEARVRAAGLSGGLDCTQVVPFHSHVSPK